VSVEGRQKRTLLDIPQISFESEAGFGYLPKFTVEVGG